MEEKINFYLNKLNTHKSTGYLFGVMPIAPGSPALFSLFTILLFALFGAYIQNPYIAAIPLFLILVEHNTIATRRIRAFEECLVNDAFMQNDFIENGIDPNFPYDPLYVTEEDREDIFYEATIYYKREKFTQKIKNNRIFLLIAMVLYVGVYGLFKLFI